LANRRPLLVTTAGSISTGLVIWLSGGPIATSAIETGVALAPPEAQAHGTIAVAWAVVATWAALWVSKGSVRRLVTYAGALLGCAAFVVSWADLQAYQAEVATLAIQLELDVAAVSTTWRWWAMMGGLCVGLACWIVAIFQAPRWPELSAKYQPDAPDDRLKGELGNHELNWWKAQDQGRDPTALDDNLD
jgi:hypothetical protein